LRLNESAGKTCRRSEAFNPLKIFVATEKKVVMHQDLIRDWNSFAAAEVCD
jgi:hypothetical protein